MILEPGFFTHPKTIMLQKILGGDVRAPLYVIKLWCYCQERKAVIHRLTSEFLKIVCGFDGNANRIESALSTSGFIRRDGDSIEVLNWCDYNSKLMAAWKNGAKGGRPGKIVDGWKEGDEEMEVGAQAKVKSEKGARKKSAKNADEIEKNGGRKPKNEKEGVGVKDSKSMAPPEAAGGGFENRELDDDPVQVVYDCYRKHHPRMPPVLHRSSRERRLIEARLKEFDGMTLMDAIEGCHKSAFHCGANDRGKKYQSLALIFRDADHVRDFAEMANDAGGPVLSQKTQQTMAARESFLARIDELLGESRTKVIDVE